MGIITSFSRWLSNRKKCAPNEATRRKKDSPIELVKQSWELERVIELQVVEQDENLANEYIAVLKEHAKSFEESGIAQCKVTDKTIRLMFNREKTAKLAYRLYEISILLW